MNYLSIKHEMQELRRFLAENGVVNVTIFRICEPVRPHSLGILYTKQKGHNVATLEALLDSFTFKQQQAFPDNIIAPVKIVTKF